MDLSPEEIDQISEALSQLESVDAAELPEPAAELVALLSRLLEETEEE